MAYFWAGIFAVVLSVVFWVLSMRTFNKIMKAEWEEYIREYKRRTSNE